MQGLIVRRTTPNDLPALAISRRVLPFSPKSNRRALYDDVGEITLAQPLPIFVLMPVKLPLGGLAPWATRIPSIIHALLHFRAYLYPPYPEAAAQPYTPEKVPVMEVHFGPELEAKLTHSAAQQSCNPDQLVQDVVSRYFEEEARFVEPVKRGEEALQQGEYLTREQRSNP